MLKIRLLRVGKKNQPFYKIVVTDKRNPPQGGRFKEQVGTLNPVQKNYNLKEDRIKYWLSVGAQPSKRMNNLLIEEGLIEGDKKDVRPERSLITGLENKEKEEEKEIKEEKGEEEKKETNKEEESQSKKKEEEDNKSDKKESSSKKKDDSQEAKEKDEKEEEKKEEKNKNSSEEK